MRTIASKVDNDLHEALVKRCSERGCSPSEYLRVLLKQDIMEGGSGYGKSLDSPAAAIQLQRKQFSNGVRRRREMHFDDFDSGVFIAENPSEQAMLDAAIARVKEARPRT